MSVTGQDIAHWREWVGKTRTVTARIEPAMAQRYAAALGEDADRLPSLGHWAYFIDAVPPSGLGEDGHPKRGGFLPPVSLASRMFAASDLTFHRPLELGEEATCRARVANLDHKQGGSGDLILVQVLSEIEQGGQTCIEERQTILYRDPGAAIPPVEDRQLALPAGAESWTPGKVDLFRYSAVTFNSHRIHYDQPYATGEEGYPALVVHGPFTASRLFGFATRRHGPLRRFSFRAQAPLFVDQPIQLCEGETPGQVLARRCDGVTAMVAHFES